MSNNLILPPLSQVIDHEGKGNFAVSKYYTWPFRYFYCKKLGMIMDMLDEGRVYKSTLDFGAGAARIMERTLKTRTWKYTAIDLDDAQPIEKFDLIVCGSVLEFVDIDDTLKYFKKHLLQGGQIIGSSPMKSILSSIYFTLVNDNMTRHSHKSIMESLEKHFYIVHKREWMGLYFSFKATLK